MGQESRCEDTSKVKVRRSGIGQSTQVDTVAAMP